MGLHVFDDTSRSDRETSIRGGYEIPRFPMDIYRRINAIELALVVLIVFVAALMARGAWMF
jgi:hypothetical protein